MPVASPPCPSRLTTVPQDMRGARADCIRAGGAIGIRPESVAAGLSGMEGWHPADHGAISMRGVLGVRMADPVMGCFVPVERGWGSGDAGAPPDPAPRTRSGSSLRHRPGAQGNRIPGASCSTCGIIPALLGKPCGPRYCSLLYFSASKGCRHRLGLCLRAASGVATERRCKRSLRSLFFTTRPRRRCLNGHQEVH